jgi:hypothetical protein
VGFNIRKVLLGVFTTGFAMQSHAFTCFLTQMKDDCWKTYNVTVDVYDSTTNKKLVSAIVPTGSLWTRQQFTCQPGQTLRFQAQFTPVFWQNDEGKTWYGNHFWTLPAQPQTGETAWNIPLCFPGDFAEVPMPPQATNNCQCSSSGIPPIEAPSS